VVFSASTTVWLGGEAPQSLNGGRVFSYAHRAEATSDVMVASTAVQARSMQGLILKRSLRKTEMANSEAGTCREFAEPVVPLVHHGATC
jgi:hypothetical protein